MSDETNDDLDEIAENSADMSRIFQRYEGTTARVYLYGGRALIGALHFENGWVEVDNGKGKHAACNLNYVVSISPA